MGLQRFRADRISETCANGAHVWVADWMGGPSLAKVTNCPTPFGPRTVYVTREPDTFFSVPAACTWRGRTVRGFLTYEEGRGGWTFTANRSEWVWPSCGAPVEVWTGEKLGTEYRMPWELGSYPQLIPMEGEV